VAGGGTGGPDHEGLDRETFAALMAPLGPFESLPLVAVGVSGGPDSLALCLLLQDWAVRRGGRVVALTVDHGLRAEAAAEAQAVGRLLADRGIEHEILRIEAAAPATGIQAWARTERRRLLLARCADRGILHLALGHRLEDQAETLLLRLSRGSGPDGLAGMAAVREEGPARILRPLLGIARARIEATCRAFGLPWVEDPSNTVDRFARGRLRAVAPLLAAEGMDAERLFDAARRAGRARAALDAATAALLGRAARIYPEGYVLLDPHQLADASDELALRALRQVLAVVGASSRPVRDGALERLWIHLAAEARMPVARLPARTLAGCRIGFRRGSILVTREPAAAIGRVPIRPGETVHWDRRFRVALPAPAGEGGWTVASLGRVGQGPDGQRFSAFAASLPSGARASLPAVWDRAGLLAVPALGYARTPDAAGVTATFLPGISLSSAVFHPARTVV